MNFYYLSIYLDPLLAEEIRRCVQDISCMRRVVVRVTGVVVSFNYLQPGAQSGLRAVQELADPKPREDFQAQVGQRPVGGVGMVVKHKLTPQAHPQYKKTSQKEKKKLDRVPLRAINCVVASPFHGCSL